jgi:hypothetical protein
MLHLLLVLIAETQSLLPLLLLRTLLLILFLFLELRLSLLGLPEEFVTVEFAHGDEEGSSDGRPC